MKEQEELPEMVEVESSNIKARGYNKETKTLYLEFHSGGIYKYHPFSSQKNTAFVLSESKGSYFFKNIKNDKSITCEKL